MGSCIGSVPTERQASNQLRCALKAIRRVRTTALPGLRDRSGGGAGRWRRRCRARTCARRVESLVERHDRHNAVASINTARGHLVIVSLVRRVDEAEGKLISLGVEGPCKTIRSVLEQASYAVPTGAASRDVAQAVHRVPLRGEIQTNTVDGKMVIHIPTKDVNEVASVADGIRGKRRDSRCRGRC